MAHITVNPKPPHTSGSKVCLLSCRCYVFDGALPSVHALDCRVHTGRLKV